MSKIVSANLLLTGEVVYLGPSHRWVSDIDLATRYAAADDAKWRKFADQALAADQVIDVTTIDVDASSDEPVRLRERIRALGPTIHPAFARRKSAAAA
ncbi:MAG: DUF2849 domain-containing protein [Rhodobacteraceae bacterium]|nr:DUF2849 domain-containing protein [Paracoccaceae bacterium]